MTSIDTLIIDNLESIADKDRRVAFLDLYENGLDSDYYEEYWDEYTDYLDNLMNEIYGYMTNLSRIG